MTVLLNQSKTTLERCHTFWVIFQRSRAQIVVSFNLLSSQLFPNNSSQDVPLLSKVYKVNHHFNCSRKNLKICRHLSNQDLIKRNQTYTVCSNRTIRNLCSIKAPLKNNSEHKWTERQPSKNSNQNIPKILSFTTCYLFSPAKTLLQL